MKPATLVAPAAVIGDPDDTTCALCAKPAVDTVFMHGVRAGGIDICADHLDELLVEGEYEAVAR